MESSIPNPKLDSEEVAANPSQIRKFGWFRTWDALAGGDIARYNEILKQPYIVVLTKLRLSYEQANYDRRLGKLRSEKMNKK